MRPLLRHPAQLGAAVLALAAFGFSNAAQAQNFGNPNSPYFYSSQNYSYGLNLPQVPLPNGQDEIRAADGTACRSNAASNGAYLDVGAIGSQGYGGEYDQGTFYGRVIMPLGETPRRLDCTALYNLEIERLRHELALIRSGAGAGALSAAPEAAASKVASAAVMVPTAASSKKTAGVKQPAWAETGWSTTGWKPPAKVGAADVVPVALSGGIPVAAIEPAAELEILPWSTTPAEGSRMLTGISAPKAALRPAPVDDDLPIQRL